MKALTLHRPWPWALVHTPKSCENRSWSPFRHGKRLLEPGDWLAIHAGREWDAYGAEILRAMGFDCPAEGSHPAGQIVAVASYLGWFDEEKLHRPGSRSATLRQHLEEADSESFIVGPRVWVFEEVLAISPGVPARGQPGLWDVGVEEGTLLAERMRGGGPSLSDALF